MRGAKPPMTLCGACLLPWTLAAAQALPHTEDVKAFAEWAWLRGARMVPRFGVLLSRLSLHFASPPPSAADVQCSEEASSHEE